MHKPPAHILPLIVLSQFAGTSLWFVGNAVLPELKAAFGLSVYAVSLVTSAVMLGFIAGTLLVAFFSLADRFSAVKLFFISCVAAALCNVGIMWWVHNASTLFVARFLTGVFLAGIYPVGMKIAADWYEKGLGKALGYLVGALVLGTAFPHLLKNRSFSLPWKTVLLATSTFAALGGLLMLLFVGDGPYGKRGGRFQLNAIAEIFRSQKWRAAAFGYFGHMWEIYTFWGFLPLMLQVYSQAHHIALNIPLLSFIIIAIGSIGCVLGGYIAQAWGAARTASVALLLSGACCLLSPLAFLLPLALFLFFLLVWGFTVAPDSPQFSTLAAQYAPPHLKGTALTIYNSIGFAITTASLFAADYLFHGQTIFSGDTTFLVLALGAATGLPFMWRLVKPAL